MYLYTIKTMAALLPLLAMGIPALLSGVSGIMGIADQAKKLRGGRLRRMHHKRGGRVHHIRRRIHMRRRKLGRGVAANILGSIPVLGSILGPIVSAMGGRVRRRHHKRMRGHGLSPMYYTRPYVGMGMRRHHKRMRHRKRGHGLSPMYYTRPYVGMGMLGPLGSHVLAKYGRGLLAPAGGYKPYIGGTVRKGHYRKIRGRGARIRVRPTLIMYKKKSL